MRRECDDQNLHSVLSLPVDSPVFAVPFHKAHAEVAFLKMPGRSQDFRRELALDLCVYYRQNCHKEDTMKRSCLYT